MNISRVLCAILAPTLVSAAAFAIPEPTQPVAPAADNWSPAPTAAPQLGFHLFGREAQHASQDNTCGYVSGLSASSITCPNSKAICATNTFFGVHGCCDPSALSSCTIATTCIPSTAMSSLCTDDACSSNNAIAKCTAPASPACYRWLFAYESTTMTQHGCAASGFTSTAQRSYGPSSTSTPSPLVVTVTASATPSASPSADNEPKQSLGPIIGGTVGGCIIVSLVALAALFIHRRRRRAANHSRPPPSRPHHNSPEFHPGGFPAAAWNEQDFKTWQRPDMPCLGVSEVHGEDRAVEVEAPEKSKVGVWHASCPAAAVEVEALGREKGWRPWQGIVEAPS
ncbi:hypothetical protein ST47_g4506 [Ascochyta rabiei]|uniref:Transmembrane transport n=1 Tax=Didymella rabiei TaxID=5454 RepID=A0A163FF74_DIDRA|nr:hypothetical protein ST47_g4506 [Ascochyta rabiei]